MATVMAGLLMPSPSVAQTRTVRDRADDTKPVELSWADVRKVKASYGGGRISVTVKVPDLPYSEATLEVYLDRPGNSIYPYIRRLDVEKTGNKTKASLIEYYDYDGVDHHLPCKVNAKWSLSKHRIKVSAPKSCIHWNAVKLHVVMGALGESENGNVYAYDSVKSFKLRYN